MKFHSDKERWEEEIYLAMANVLIIVYASVLFGHLPLFENSNLILSSSVQFSMREIYLTEITAVAVLFVRLGGLGGIQKPKGVSVSYSPTDKQLICRSSAKQVSSSKGSQH